MQDLCMWISCAYLCVRISASGSCMTTCARSLYADLFCKISLSGCLHQDPVGLLVQNLCMRISCARCLRSPQQNPVGALVQDRCMRISCARCPFQDLLSRSLVQDLCMRISCARSLCQDVCVRILQDLLCKISV